MIIEKISIKKFRGFQDTEIEIGSSLTVIAGRNGTQKTTVLGMLSQPFTITDNKNPMKGEKPLSGGSFKSAFSEMFKLSDTFDKDGTHEWSIHITDKRKHLASKNPFIVESIKRSATGQKTTPRFWQKGDRSAGSGYICVFR